MAQRARPSAIAAESVAPGSAAGSAAAADPRQAAYERAWHAFISSPIWDIPGDKRSERQQADLDALADAAHDAFWKWKSGRG